MAYIGTVMFLILFKRTIQYSILVLVYRYRSVSAELQWHVKLANHETYDALTRSNNSNIKPRQVTCEQVKVTY